MQHLYSTVQQQHLDRGQHSYSTGVQHQHLNQRQHLNSTIQQQHLDQGQHLYSTGVQEQHLNQGQQTVFSFQQQRDRSGWQWSQHPCHRWAAAETEERMSTTQWT